MSLEDNICQKSSGTTIKTLPMASTSPDFNEQLKDIIFSQEKSNSTKGSSDGDE